MSDICTLRCYFPHGARLNAEGFWKKLRSQPLGLYLIKEAKRADIQQALLISAHAGYLAGHPLRYRHPEYVSIQHPDCVELIDSKPRLKAFAEQHREQLHDAQIMMFSGEPI
ncbi:DUF190 domain-containing protein [Shimwellia pseudoproteus]|uniref:DUF190 domain-containing protein n=1 Tax=Shimwellia pseudoproteus TaxID=570012 RepID=UPI0018EA35E5|nr:DUF190 domain-containing protein [Shimwellia pseudoproteus]MBJ3813847.1 DUF190 domain-containing protein [Shimwellia pseudoproteus]